LLDIRFDGETECVDYFEQCCAVGSVTDTPTNLPPGVVPPGQTNNVPGGGGNYNPGGGPTNVGPGPGPGINPGPGPNPGQGQLTGSAVCGFRNAEGVGFRITGNSDGESEYGE
jgi:hypothetical protein